MPVETSASGSALSRRVAALSPEKRAVLERRLLQNAAGAASLVEDIPVQPRDGRRDFPLSAAQERMWFNHQWSPDLPVYNESFGLKFEGSLAPDLMAQSFNVVMARHESFATTFHSSDGRLFQRIEGCPRPRLELHDLRDLDQAQRQTAYEDESRRLIREPFRLDEGPLFRGGLWTMGEAEYRLVFAMHHIIFDGWSGGILFRELLSVYGALAEGREPQLPPVRLQYADFAVWEQSRFEQDPALLSGQLDYWKKQLRDMGGPLRLPADRQVTSDGAHPAGREIFVCPAPAIQALKSAANEANATLFMALLSLFNILLARYTGQEDIVVGLPTANRNHSALNGTVGVFINTLILRTDLTGDVTFRQLLARVRAVSLDAQANQELPLQQLVHALELKGDAGRSLVRVLFDLQKKSDLSVESPAYTIQGLDVGNGVAKFDLVLAIEDSGDDLKGVLDYDAEMFEAGTARQMAGHFIALMRSAVDQPDVPVSRLPMMTPAEIDGLEARGESTPEARWACRETLNRALESPQALALSDNGNVRTYAELADGARSMAAALLGRNIGPGHNVVLLLPAGLNFVAAQLAVMMTGAAFVPIDPAYPAARIEYIVRDCGASLLIANSNLAEDVPADVPVLRLDRDRWQPSGTLRRDMPTAKANDPAYIIYTSGSTGQPKGVAVSRGALANLIGWHRRAFGITSADRATQVASVAFDASVWEIWPYLAAGASVHFPPRELAVDSRAMRDWLNRNRITVSFAPTPLAEGLIETEWPANSTLRWLLTGGDRLRKRAARALPFELVNNYGPTENAVVATSGIVSPVGEGSPTIGRPIDNVWARVVDRNLEPVPVGVIGELLIGGRSLAAGYWNRPELTNEKFVSLGDGRRGYRTGDLCRFRRDGELEFIGRADTQVKVRGCRIELGEIEVALLAHGEIRDAIADLRDFASGQKGIVAYVVPEGRFPGSDALRAFLTKRLPGHMIPSVFLQIDAVPRTSNGKADRQQLPSPEVTEVPAKHRIEPRSATEEAIAELWKSTLSITAVGVRDDFFQLGGDSLSATRLAVTLRETFSVELPLARMMSAPTIEALAAFVDRATRREGQSNAPLPSGLIPLRTGNPRLPPLFLTPPASGSPACYAVWADAFQEDRAIYGFEAPGLSDGKAVWSIPGQALRYVDSMIAAQPDGPYYIAGWSLGGPVAFEIACQLREAGKDVAYLGMVDAGLPENGRLPGGISLVRGLWWAVSYPFTERIPLNYPTLRLFARWMGIVLPESFGEIRKRGWSGGARFARGLLANGARSLCVLAANLTALRKYQPRTFDGPVTLFRTAPPGSAGQDELLRDGVRKRCARVDVYDAPGTHMTLMLDARVASRFAPAFEATLRSEYLSRQNQDRRGK